jgi:1-deoxy-D-xylulose-5-phosphate reductoisomerase
LLTASGGPFRTWDNDAIVSATPEQALAHPNWVMGTKVTIDSSTLMNKALEIIEAKWLFNVSMDQIEVIIHPQSIVHSMVEFIDGSIIAQMSLPTMHIPIQYALSYPDRIETSLVTPLDLTSINTLEFFKPDEEKFPCIKLAYKAGMLDKTFPAVMNAANEIAVNAYVKGKIKFYDIYNIVNDCLDKHDPIDSPSLEDIMQADAWARAFANRVLY